MYIAARRNDQCLSNATDHTTRQDRRTIHPDRRTTSLR